MVIVRIILKEYEKMVLKVADRGKMPPFIVMDVMQAASLRESKGGDVLHLEVGQPSTKAPSKVITAAKTALENDKLGYTPALGLLKLRADIAKHYKDWYEVDIPLERIVATKGSSAAFILSFMAAFDPGDRVVMASPGYPAYRNILKSLGITPISILTELKHRFQPTVALLEELEQPIDGLIIASPSNPAGTMIGYQQMQELSNYCKKKEIRLISDEIYHGVNYGQQPVSALETHAESIIINSFSKYFSMTGWRLGWMIVPQDLARSVECLAQNMFISPPTLSQIAASAAFDSYDEAEDNVKRYAINRSILMNELPSSGLDKLAPADGAFYIYADIAHFTNDSVEFCKRMLEEIGVACTPGLDFDPDRGDSTLRLSFSGAEHDMIEACKRIKTWLKK